MLPTLIHDALYQFIRTHAMRDRIDRKTADQLFYHAMAASRFALRGPYFHAVRFFGGRFIADNPVHSVILP